MTATAHAIVGGVIAAGTPNLAISLPLALGSHFLMDLVPHWDVGTNFDKRPKTVSAILAAIDVLLGALIVFLVFGGSVNPLNLWLTVFFAQSPDWIEAPYLFFNLNFAPSRIIERIQHKIHSRLDLPWGIITQIFLILPLISETPTKWVF